MKPKKRNLNGILLVDKPLGLSSNAVLQKMKWLYRAKKAGHTGSLDPLATGMLPICFGEATKFSQYLLDANKTYEVVAQLGAISSTGDAEGELTHHADQEQLALITNEQIHQSVNKFLGIIKQVPPMYSALKHKGQPLYKLARQGEVVERKARKVTIFSNQILSDLTQLEKNNWQIKFKVSCSKGTYIRTLIEDIGLDLSCGAYVKQLRRLAVTPYENSPMHNFEELFSNTDELPRDYRPIAMTEEKLDSLLLPMDTAVNTWPEIKLTEIETKKLTHGQELILDQKNILVLKTNSVRFYDQNKKFLGIGECDLTTGKIIKRRLVAIV